MEYNKVAVASTGREASIRDEPSILTLIGQSADLARSIEETVRALENNLFGYREHDAPPDEPRCFRDVCAQHAESMKRIDVMLSSIKERLGA